VVRRRALTVATTDLWTSPLAIGMRVPLAIAMLLALGLAGCSDEPAPPGDAAEPTTTTASTSTPPSASPDTPPAAEGPETIAWEILDCFFIYATPFALASEVEAALPEGFTIASTGGLTQVGIEANVCTSGQGLNGTIEPAGYGSVWVGVVPPEGQGDAGVGHFVNFDVLIQDEPRRTWMQERGIPARDGSVERSDLPGGGVTVDFTMDGVGTFAYEVPVAQSAGDAGGTFDQWTPGSEGLTYWITDWQTKGQFVGVGTVDIPAGSIYAAWFPTPTVAAQVGFGTWDYTNGRIVHPA
jgi:hypothetical protein